MMSAPWPAQAAVPVQSILLWPHLNGRLQIRIRYPHVGDESTFFDLFSETLDQSYTSTCALGGSSIYPCL